MRPPQDEVCGFKLQLLDFDWFHGINTPGLQSRPSAFLIFFAVFFAVLGSISLAGSVVTLSPTQIIAWPPLPRNWRATVDEDWHYSFAVAL